MTTQNVEPKTTTESLRPAWIPEKFWDEKLGKARLEALAQSYLELENRLGSNDAQMMSTLTQSRPADHAGYDIMIDDDYLDVDEDINQRLFENGFSNAQAQLVYDLASERLLPLVEQVAAEYENDREVKKLHDHFGGAERFDAIRPQLRAWGAANMEDKVFKSLIASADGVIALHEMMKNREPALMRTGDSKTGANEENLKSMMKDPRYWKQRDPAFVAKVRDGFKALYPEG